MQGKTGWLDRLLNGALIGLWCFWSLVIAVPLVIIGGFIAYVVLSSN